MESLFALVLATAVLVMIPGPNVALIVATSIGQGFRAGAVTVLGTTLGLALQLILVVLGLAALIEFLADAFVWLRWLGVLYLIALGIKTWRSPPTALDTAGASPAAFWRGCLVAMVNPKTLLFVAAFIPQFVDPAGNPVLQLTVAASVYLSIVLVGDLLWAAFATSARPLLQQSGKARNRLTGGFLVAAGIGLAFANRQ